MEVFRSLTPDGKKILLARGARGFAFGFISLVIAVYLNSLGFEPILIGIVLSLTLVGSAVSNIAVSLWADKLGRRKTLVLFSLLMISSSAILILSSNIIFISLAALIGSISSTGSDTGPFLSVEQSVLPDTVPRRTRNSLFAFYNIAGTLAGALGSLFSGINLGKNDFTIFFAVYGLIAVLIMLDYLALSPRIEYREITDVQKLSLDSDEELKRSRSAIARLSALFSMDSFASGFVVQSFVAFWFELQFDANPENLSLIFFSAGLLTTLSFFLAAKIADRIGLIRTMVFTHIPSNVLLILVPFAPTFGGAIAFWLGRMSLSQMDVPTRQAYTVSVVMPRHRTAAVALTGLSRNVTQTVGPSLAGYLLQVVSSASPFFIGGTLKIVYDTLIYANFRNLREK
jgi:MFS family permease